MISSLYFIRDEVAAGGDPSDDIGGALKAAESAAELTRSLLAIGRRQTVQPQKVELTQLVHEALELVRRAVPKTVEVVYHPPAASCHVAVDPPQMQQVLLNLCLNARDAMDGGGTLTVIVCPSDADRATVIVEDTGTGIDQDTVARIFEPFYTTKEPGSGTGLGLAVAAGIVQSHGGTIDVESEIGEGSRFTIRLPYAEELDEADTVKTAEQKGAATVLVAEDDELVRRQIVRLLGKAGYRVVEAKDGVEAVDQFRRHQREISLVLMDVVMPRRNGWRAYEAIVEIDDGATVLFMSGYAAGALPELSGRPMPPLIGKPFTGQKLLTAVRAALAPQPAEAEARAAPP